MGKKLGSLKEDMKGGIFMSETGRLRDDHRYLARFNECSPAKGGLFLLKKCPKCRQKKLLSEFYLRKSGKYKGEYHSLCKKCDNKYVKKWKKINAKTYIEYCRKYELEYRKGNPWVKTYRKITSRCCKSGTYHKRGISYSITITELKKLWFRDKAYLMKKPSIDRINGGNYTLDNCRYIELVDNLRRKKGGKQCQS